MTIQISKTKTIYLFHNYSQLEIALSIRNLSTLLKSGIDISEALGVVSNQIQDEKLKKVYESVQKDVQSGVTLAEAMKKFPDAFSTIITSIIDVGEQGATLENNLLFLSDYLKKNYELHKKIKGATTYPIIILFMTFIEFIGIIYFILPKLEALFSTFKNIPDFTKGILNLSAFIRENGVYLLIGGIIILIFINWALGTKPGKRFKDFVALRFPVFKKMNVADILSTFSRTLAILLESGIPLQKALVIAQATMLNSYYAHILGKVTEDVKAGKNLASSLAVYPKYFPESYRKMVEIGEETGNLEDNLTYLYDLYTEDLTEMSNNITTLIEPLLLIFIGVLIGGLALLIITPIYQLTGSINEV